MGNEFETIAERELDLTIEDHVSKIYARLGKPFKSGDCPWECPYQIVGAGDETIYCVCGEDAVQALQLAMKMIGNALQILGRDAVLTHLGNSDLGFPRFESACKEDRQPPC